MRSLHSASTLLLLLVFFLRLGKKGVAMVRGMEFRQVTEKDPSFFELAANDADGRRIDFERFYGDVTIVANLGSECGTSAYQELVHLHKVFPYGVEIVGVADGTTTDDKRNGDELKRLARKEGVNVVVLQEGRTEDSPVFEYLRGMNRLDSVDCHTYFVITPDGNIEVHKTEKPMSMKDNVWRHLKQLE